MTEYSDLIKHLRDASKMSAALAVLLPNSDGNAMVKLLDDAADAIEELQRLAADVREVKMGKWIDEYPNIPNDPRMICSVCGKEAVPLSTEHFCPNCAARMEEQMC